MNLALNLPKTYKNHTENDTQFTPINPPNLTFCLSSRKDKNTFFNLLKIKDKNNEFEEIYFCNVLPRGLCFLTT